MPADKWISEFRDMATTLRLHAPAVMEHLMAVETHKTACVELEKTIRALETYADELPYLMNRRPVGDVFVFLPFNTPLYSLALYSFGPLLAGNRVKVRPSSLTSKALWPVFELLASRHPVLRAHLDMSDASGRNFLDQATNNPDTGALIFTGQWASVSDIAARVPHNAKFIYCGSGLCPFVVLADADIEAAAECAISSRLFNSGQDCLCAERFYVEASAFDPFIQLLTRKLDDVRVGPNPEPETDVGPLVAESLAQRVRALISDRGPGCQILREGAIEGALVSPFVISAPPESCLVMEEKFAPIFPIVRFESIDDVVPMINSADYALGATVFAHHPQSVASGLEIPHIAFNESILDIESSDAHVPFGGRKRSGFVQEGSSRRDGPLLFSVETTRAAEVSN